VVSSGYAGAVSAAPTAGYSRGMDGDSDTDFDRYVLFVTGPVRDRLYRRFASLFDGRDVVVKIDRRVSERRRELPGSTARERRAGDRRRRRPDWIVPPPDGI
jgi:hypothetical protein